MGFVCSFERNLRTQIWVALVDRGIDLFIAVGLDRNGKKGDCPRKVRRWERTHSGSE